MFETTNQTWFKTIRLQKRLPVVQDGGLPGVGDPFLRGLYPICRRGAYPYPLVNIQKTMENHNFSWDNQL